MPNQFGPWTQLRFLREHAGLTVIDLATSADVSRPHLTNLENGNRWPTRTVTLKLAAALGVPPAMIERHIDEHAS